MTEFKQSGFGAVLRQRREELGLSLNDLAASTRIRKTYLQALEEENLRMLPGAAYTIGFLRIYARQLGLPIEPLLAALAGEESLGEQAALPSLGGDLPRGAKKVRRRSKAGWLLFLLFLLLLGAAGYFYFKRHPQTLLSPPPPVLAPAGSSPTPPVQTSAGEAPVVTPLSGQGQSAVVPPVTAPSGQGQSAVVPPVTAPSGQSQSAVVSPVTPPSGQGQSVVVPAELPVIPATGAVIRMLPLAAGTMKVSLDSQEVREYQLQPGQSLNWKVSASLAIELSAPGLVRIWVDQQELAVTEQTAFILQSGAKP